MKLVDQIYDSFCNACLHYGLIRPHDLVLTAVSGGVDSMALLDLLQRWSESDGGFALRIAHFNHRLRPESDPEQEYVRRFCRDRGLECVFGRGDVGQFAKERKISVHAAARELRYDFLAGEAQRWRRDCPRAGRAVIATGHHRNDQIETILMRLFNGTDVDGMCGIRVQGNWHYRWKNDETDVRLIRPLLDLRRSNLERYCRNRKIDFVADRSNFDPIYPRNRIRLELLPQIERLFGEEALQGMIRTSKLVGLAGRIIDREVDEAFAAVQIPAWEDEVALDYSKLMLYLEMIRYKCVQRAVRLISPNHRFTLERIEAADRHIREKGRGTLELGDAVELSVDERAAYFYTPVDDAWEARLFTGDGVVVPKWGEIVWESKSMDRIDLPPPHHELVCDLSAIDADTVTVRYSRPGDRFVPLGTKNQRKVGDVLREQGIPLHRRAYPVVCANDRIVAVPPFRIAEAVKLTERSQRATIIRVSWADRLPKLKKSG